MQRPPDIHIETAEDLLAAVDQRRFNAEAVKDVGKFHRDIAAALDCDAARQLWQVKRLVGADAVLVAGQRLMRIGPSAGGDQNGFGAHHPVLGNDTDMMVIDKHRTAVDHLGFCVSQSRAIRSLKARDLPVLVRNQRRPIEFGPLDRPAITCRILEMFRELRGVHEELLRHAAANDTGSTEPVFFRYRDALAERCRNAPCPDTS